MGFRGLEIKISYYTPKDINGICVDGIDYQGFTRDTFALVKLNGEWMHNGSKEECINVY